VVNDFVQVGWDFTLKGNDFIPVGSDFFGGEKGHRQRFKESSDFCLMRTKLHPSNHFRKPASGAEKQNQAIVPGFLVNP
jgi:hypothetical protein